MARGILRPRAKGSEGAVAARAASVIRGSRPMEHRTGSNRPYVPSVQSDFELACQIQACPVMTGLLAGPLADAAGPGAVRADLAGVVPQLLGPARVSLRISHCDRDWLNRDRRWRGRSQADRGFDRQPAQGPDVFAVGMRHRDALDQPRSPDQHTNRHGLPVLLRA